MLFANIIVRNISVRWNADARLVNVLFTSTENSVLTGCVVCSMFRCKVTRRKSFDVPKILSTLSVRSVALYATCCFCWQFVFVSSGWANVHNNVHCPMCFFYVLLHQLSGKHLVWALFCCCHLCHMLQQLYCAIQPRFRKKASAVEWNRKSWHAIFRVALVLLATRVGKFLPLDGKNRLFL